MNIIFMAVLNRRDLSLLSLTLNSIRKYTNIPIHIYHANCLETDDITFDNVTLFTKTLTQYPDNPSRIPYRNSDLWRFEIGTEYCNQHEILYLDNDIVIVHPGFFDGFKIADYTGKAVFPINPRGYIKGNGGDGIIGTDISPRASDNIRNMPLHMTSYNTGFFFANSKSKYFIEACYKYMLDTPTRGPLVVGTVAYQLNDYPYVTSEKWLVCGDHCNEKNPLALHVGHKEVMQRWQRECMQQQ